ncbi:MAG: SPOR domain-containing protein, partial [Spirochaetales bacterium]|nr:SPOR domain-containing protein [Spirochaetales bacterium]
IVEESAALVVAERFVPPVYDTDSVDIVLEAAEPRPPEPRIGQADLLDAAEGDEPEENVEVAVLVEPEIAAETAAVVETEPEAATVVVEVVEEIETRETIETAEIPAEEIPDYTTMLSTESFYLQLGVFAEAKSAKRLQTDLEETYPVTVYLAEGSERPIYKVMVGPLNQDESGALLFQFRTRGYPDAFVRKGTVN